MLFNITRSHIEKNVITMFVAIVRYVEEKGGRYVIEWRRLPPEEEDKGYFMCALSRRWTDEEVMVLVKYQDNLKKAAKILDRSYGAVRVKWSEIRRKLGLRKTDRVKCVPFPETDLALRREVVEKLLSLGIVMRELVSVGWKEDFTNSDLWKMLTPREKIRMTRAMLMVFDCAEKWQTGKEHLEIYREEKEHADQADEG